ncbi:MAG TPA: GPW/gp25 family protein [Microthrixaceae bacterium]|nr:GPW/gp25 family protein [Microthrixaceae bacterium]HNI35099.1 GPW/gp25 family protein [Microthrixaceae bacterium]
MSEEYIGRGWTFPVRTSAAGGIALAERDNELQESMRLILSTAPGERPMRPDFGCAIHQFMFAPVDATTEGRIAQEVERALERWEPRIDLVDIVVERAPDEDATLYIDITYSVRGSNDPRNLVFPFYVIPTD